QFFSFFGVFMDFVKVMLCQTGSEADLKRPNFVCEPKYDGTRVVAIKEKGGVVRLHNRHLIDYTVRLPEIVEEVKAIPGSFVLDGEVVWINPETGREEFTPCQRRCSTEFPDPYLRMRYPLTYMVFDLIKVNGNMIVDKPYWKRKTLLRALLAKGREERVKFVPYRRDVEKAWQEAVADNREGLILKDFNSRYELGVRSWSWLKIKNWRTEECLVVGYCPSSKGRQFGSLVLASPRDGSFRGCVGSGFNDYEMARIWQVLQLSPEIPKPYPEAEVGEPYIAVKTDLKVLVKYYETTDKGHLRHPVFIKCL
ncbi:MAG: ATP-dependent DNA ligase, partial [Candidatus Bathyarchaeia archaeon]